MKYLSAVGAVVWLLLVSGIAVAQQQGFSEPQSQLIEIGAPVKVTMNKIEQRWDPQLYNFEAPSPGGTSYRSYLNRTKAAMKSSPFKGTSKAGGTVNLGDAEMPVMERNFHGNDRDGLPNDNDLAISNDGILVSVINSNIWVYDTENDTVLMDISLGDFSDTLGLTARKFDPRVIYDPKQDRFVMFFLSGNTDSTSNSVVAFSQSNDPTGDWALYSLPGDALNNGLWTDFPMVAMTDDEVFLTVNLLANDSINTSDSWKFLFVESIIWQMDKQSGYTGQSLVVKMHSNNKYNGKAIRNLTPIPGGSTTYGPDIYLLSNRNFDITNDTLFILKLEGKINDPVNQVTADITILDTPYGLAPDADQRGNRTLQTNDSRVMDGYYEDGQIHYVQMTVNPDSLRSAIYHGVIWNLDANPTVDGNIIGVDYMDFGYPNVTYSGKYPGDDEAIISFLHTSEDTFAGVSAIFYQGFEGYSERLTIKTGETYSGLGGPNVRWGDYTGAQMKYNEPGTVWISGYFGERGPFVTAQNVNSTWIGAVMSPDTSTWDPVGIADAVRPEPEIKTYPNPTSEIVMVEFELEQSEWTNISLYDINGRLIKTFIDDRVKKGRNQFSFSMQPLNAGIYILNVSNAEGIVASKRVVKE